MEPRENVSFNVGKLKAKLSAILAQVSHGQEFVVTDHNKPVAKIVSIARIPPLPKCNLESFFNEPPLPLKRGSPTSAALIRKIRDEEGR